MRVAIVTGASSGLGREYVHQIAEKYRYIEEIWIIARREERLDELALEIHNKRVRTIALDLSRKDDIEQYRTLLHDEEPEVRILVNSAGYGKIGHFEDSDLEDSLGMIHLNCEALVHITYLTIPYMTNPGTIIQMASAAAFLPQPSFAIYAASKSFVLSFSRALNVELKDRNITVTSVCPGPVSTEFFDIAETKDDIKLYKRVVMAKPSAVVEKALEDAHAKKDISVYGVAMHGLQIASKLAPHKPIIHCIK